MTPAQKLDALEWSDLGRSRTGAAVTMGIGIVAVVAFWAAAVPALIDVATARPVACNGYSAADCTALAQDGGW